MTLIVEIILKEANQSGKMDMRVLEMFKLLRGPNKGAFEGVRGGKKEIFVLLISREESEGKSKIEAGNTDMLEQSERDRF